jgi:hypothetical protein
MRSPPPLPARAGAAASAVTARAAATAAASLRSGYVGRGFISDRSPRFSTLMFVGRCTGRASSDRADDE